MFPSACKSLSVFCACAMLLVGLTVAEEEKIPESTQEFRDKINDKACNAVGNVACQKMFQGCMSPTFGLIPFFEICAQETKVDLTDPSTVFNGFCDNREKGLSEANAKALKCVCDKLMKFGEEAVIEGMKVCAKVVKEKCQVP